ncbi:MAG: IS3 family transposase [Mesorhizobium sp.]|nr:MAG: IS3 family transposase [Mesorhizobium sp.]
MLAHSAIRAAHYRFPAQLAGGAEPCPRHGTDRRQPALGSDITYLHLAEQFAYLAVVLDAFSRKVIGWTLELHLRASLAVDALKMAISARVPVPGSLIHHSDRGVQYACTTCSDILHGHGIQPSMSRVGNPYDNARAESFMKTLKQEEVAGLAYRDAPDARRRIASFIEDVYNRQRLHSALDYLTPEEYEKTLSTPSENAALELTSRELSRNFSVSQ